LPDLLANVYKTHLYNGLKTAAENLEGDLSCGGNCIALTKDLFRMYGQDAVIAPAWKKDPSEPENHDLNHVVMVVATVEEYLVCESASRNVEPLRAKRDGGYSKQKMGGTTWWTRRIQNEDHSEIIETGPAKGRDFSIIVYLRSCSDTEISAIAKRAEEKNSVVIQKRGKDGKAIGSIIINKAKSTLSARSPPLDPLALPLATLPYLECVDYMQLYLHIDAEQAQQIAENIEKLKTQRN